MRRGRNAPKCVIKLLFETIINFIHIRNGHCIYPQNLQTNKNWYFSISIVIQTRIIYIGTQYLGFMFIWFNNVNGMTGKVLVDEKKMVAPTMFGAFIYRSNKYMLHDTLYIGILPSHAIRPASHLTGRHPPVPTVLTNYSTSVPGWLLKSLNLITAPGLVMWLAAWQLKIPAVNYDNHIGKLIIEYVILA